MKKTVQHITISLLLSVFLSCIFQFASTAAESSSALSDGAAAEGQTAPSENAAVGNPSSLFENEWNYLETSLDISKGIPADASGVLGKILRNGVLRVAVNPNSAPFVFLNPTKNGEDSYTGSDIDLISYIAERMGVTVKIIPLESTQILPSLTEDQCDLTISAVLFTPGRALSYTMSKSYSLEKTSTSIGVIVKEESPISSLDDLNGKTIIAQSNSLAEAAGITNIKQYLEFRRVSSVHTVFESVMQGTADAGIVNSATAGNYISRNPDCGLRLIDSLSIPLDEHYLGYRVAAKKGETQLIAFVNGVIDEILSNGTYETWLESAKQQSADLNL